jgi:ATP-dependent DNA ligase
MTVPLSTARLVAVDEQGRPTFNLLQNLRSSGSRLKFYAFDVLIHNGEDLMKRYLRERREVLAEIIEPHDYGGVSQVSEGSAAEMLQFVKAHGT